jgi:hypothetical protein
VLSGELGPLLWPPDCAACGAATEAARCLRGPAEVGESWVPYCTSCLERISRHEWLVRSVGITSLVLTSCIGLALPLLWPAASRGTALAVSLAVAALPWLVAYWRSGSPGRPQASASVWWLDHEHLACAHAAFAAELAALNGLLCVPRRVWRVAAPARWLLAPVTGLALAAGVYDWQHPTLRVLNLGAEPLWLAVDGVPQGALEPVAAESPAAGLELRLPRGLRQLTTSNIKGEIVASLQVELQSRHDHLYAPGAEGQCFWLEQTGYGREHGHRIIPLVSAERFWRLDTTLDTWFVPSPEPSRLDERSSGGTLTALRYARCDTAPASARP